MKYKVLLSLKNNKKSILEMLSPAVMIGALRVNKINLGSDIPYQN